MLDFDLAELYAVDTKVLNQAVKRNRDRFPKDFMFRLTTKEWKTMLSQIVITSDKQSQNSTLSRNLKFTNWSQIVTSSEKGRKSNSSQIAISSKKHRGKVYMPYAFSEHGVTMLASVLKSDRAVKMNIAIVRAFIDLRQIALHHKDLAEKLDQLKKEMYDRLGEHDAQLNAIYDAIENLLDDKSEKKNWEERERIGYKK